MINEIHVDEMIQLKKDLINFKDYYIKNKNKTDQGIKRELSIINENSRINVNNCIEYYESLPGKIYLHNSGGFFYTKKKILIQPIINDLIGKLDLIIKQHYLINQKINEMNSSSHKKEYEQLIKIETFDLLEFKKEYEQLIKIETFNLLELCKKYITELQNLNKKIYQKKNYENIEDNYLNILLQLIIQKIYIAYKSSTVAPPSRAAPPSTAAPLSSRAAQLSRAARSSRAAPLSSRAAPPSTAAPLSSRAAQSTNVSASLVYLNELKKLKQEGGRIRRVKNENKKMNEKVAKKKITTNKIKRKYLVKK